MMTEKNVMLDNGWKIADNEKNRIIRMAQWGIWEEIQNSSCDAASQLGKICF